MEAGVRIVDAYRFITEAAGDSGPLLVTQIDSSDILADIVAAVHSPPVQPVTILQRLGLQDEKVQKFQWEDLTEKVEPDHLTSCFIPHLESPIASELQNFVELVSDLRIQCPWDAEQTHSSLTSHLLEETYEVLEAAGTKWNFLKFSPGLVGGHCIGVDPYYLTHKAKELGFHAQIINSGRAMNDAMGAYVGRTVAKKVIAAGTPMKDARVLVMGATFKEDVSDIRNSKVVDVINELKSFSCHVEVVDPHADSDELFDEYLSCCYLSG